MWSNVITIFLQFVLMIAYFVLELVGRQGSEAKSFRAGESDQGSTRLIVFALMSGIFSVPLLGVLHLGWLDGAPWLSWLGIALMVVGLIVRVWAFRTLQQFYTRTLLVSQTQQLIQHGLYRFVRHPGYFATILVWIGYGLASANWIAIGFIIVLMLVAYLYRIRSEEAMLISTFGEQYRAYQSHTKRLIPFIY